MEIIFVFFATQRYSILQNFIYFEYFSVKFGLPLHRPRIGPRRGGHTPQPHVPPGIFEPDALAYGRFAAPRDRTQRIGGFLAGGDEGAAGRDTRQQGGEIHLAHDLKKIIRRIVFQPDDFDRRVVECDPAAAAEGLDALLVEFPAAGHQEMRLVAVAR